MKTLTPRQQEILDLISAHIAKTGFPPTRMDICNALGFKSPNAAEEHLRALERKGAISLSSGTSRGIRLLHAAPRTAFAEESGLGIPLIGRVAAGQPMLAQEHIEAHYSIDAGLFAQMPDYFLKVRGMSMRDAGILDGDLLAVKRTQEARNGQIVVARVGDDVTVKRWQRKGAVIQLLAENPLYPPIVLDARSETVAVEGIGVGLLRTGRSL